MKKIGLFLDHSEARFIDPENQKFSHVVRCELNGLERIPGESAIGGRVSKTHSTNNEHQEHNRQQNALKSYYKEVAENLKTYDSIYLFGPTTARDELCNFIAKQNHFNGKKIVSEKADYMTDNQIVAKVSRFFS